ncbi:MAG: hypothetical protein KY053_01300 [Candidatus Liptonbacteria bacterium]|nr:hypothetical protein [Candidatus Liptonbacteria bacterium]
METTHEILTIAIPLIFLIALIFWGVISAVLNHHWTRYGLNAKKIKIIQKIYFGLSVAFLAIMFALMIIYLLYD